MSSREKDDELITEGEVELYRRARERWRAPEPPGAIAVAVLSRFVELQYAAVATADAAAGRARDPELRAALRRLGEGQKALARELGEAVRGYGGAPPEPAESKQELAAGPDAIPFAQGDSQLLRVVGEGLGELERRYREAAAEEGTPEDARRRLRTLAEVQARAKAELEG